MKEIRNKLDSKKGASILLALMLFFVCFMVASVILSSATANADKIREREEMQREYLSVSSAAKVLQDTIGGVKYTGWEKKEIYYCKAEKANLDPVKHEDPLPQTCQKLAYDEGLAEIIRADLHEMVYKAFLSHTNYAAPKVVPKTLLKEFEISGENMETVKVKLSLNSDTYELTCFLTVGGITNAMTVIFHGNAGSVESLENLQDIHWKQEADEDGGDTWSLISYDHNIYTTTTEITYDAGMIKKGVYP